MSKYGPSEMHFYDIVTNLALFLSKETDSVFSTWTGTLPAKTQRKMFGRYLGKGSITINGAEESIVHNIKVCFGQDFTHTFRASWKDIPLTQHAYQ